VRALVAGGAGFIGSWLCEAALQAGWDVLCVDSFITGSRGNVEHLLGDPRFILLEHDVCQPLTDLPSGDLDLVFHLASPASPKDFLPKATEILRANSAGTLNLLELAARHGARFVLASTSEVYGEPEVHPQTESYRGNVNPLGRRSCYDEGKRFAEAAVAVAHREGKTRAVVARLFNCYGPRMAPDDGRVVPTFGVQALRGEPITVYGDGSHTRSFCYVQDTVAGLMALAQWEGGGDEVEAFNLGNPNEVSTLEIARQIKAICQSESEIVFRPLPFADEPTRRQPDISKIRAACGWEPRVGLVDGLTMTMGWLRTVVGVS
jgi:nucleoside-diphosphate-sugar epimerase